LYGEHLCQGQEQVKDLFHKDFARLLRIPETGIVEYKRFRDNSYAKDFKILNDKLEYGLEKTTMQPIKNMYGYICVTYVTIYKNIDN
jgi:hypothetical protein